MKLPTLRTTTVLGLLLMAALAIAVVGCQPTRPAASVSAPAPAPVRAAAKLVWNGKYAEHVQPIFTQRCVSCHGPSRAENGLKLASYEELMKGTQFGSVVVPGSASASTLLAVLRGTTDPSIRMPHGGERLSEVELQNVTLWIEAGAPSN